MNEDIWRKGYAFGIDSKEESDGHRGRILVKAHRYTGRKFDPPVVIETPMLFKRGHAAEIEASVLARESIDHGLLEDRIEAPRSVKASAPASQLLSGNANSDERPGD